MDIILFGMQGSGKGTQGKLLAEKYGLKVFEMGGELRRMIESGSELGNKIKSIVSAGNLVDDETVMQVVDAFLDTVKSDQPVLFDGIPRTQAQADRLMKALKTHGRDAFGVLIKITEDQAIERLTTRRICSKCKTTYPSFYSSTTCSACGGDLVTRHDDNLESIKTRLQNFKTETLPVIKSFYDIDHLIEIDGEQGIENVTADMIERTAYLFS
jgi:adenylate kinase